MVKGSTPVPEPSVEPAKIPTTKKADGELQILSVIAADPGAFADPEISSIAVLSTDLNTIAIPIKQTADGVRILPLSPEVPRLFCDFPLLGTETFRSQ